MGARQGTGWGGTGTGKGHGMGTRDGDTAPGAEPDLRSPGPGTRGDLRRGTRGPFPGPLPRSARADPARGSRPAGMPRERERAEHVGDPGTAPLPLLPGERLHREPSGLALHRDRRDRLRDHRDPKLLLPHPSSRDGTGAAGPCSARSVPGQRGGGGLQGDAGVQRGLRGLRAVTGQQRPRTGPGSTGGAAAGLGHPGTGQPPGYREESRAEQRGPGPRRTLREMGVPGQRRAAGSVRGAAGTALTILTMPRWTTGGGAEPPWPGLPAEAMAGPDGRRNRVGPGRARAAGARRGPGRARKGPRGGA